MISIVKKLILVVLLVTIIIVGGLFGIRKYFLSPVDKNNSDIVEFTINSGDSPMTIINNLKSEKLIRNINSTYKKVIQKNEKFYANTYALSKNMSTNEILETLNTVDSNAESKKLVVPEGSTVEQIANSASAITNYQVNDFLDLWSNEKYLKKQIKKYWFLDKNILNKDVKYPLEGYLGAATYEIFASDSIEDISKKLLDAQANYLAPYKCMDFPNGYDINQIMTLASIVERETKRPEDLQNVASVFYNRLDEEMPLQSDITVLYALGQTKALVSYDDLEVESPYNTYTNTGLPPSPIATPSKNAIEATIHPAKTKFLYFFANQKTGEIYFSEDYEKHTKISKEHAWT